MQTLDASTKRAAWHERRHSAEAQFINRPFRNDDVKVDPLDIDERLSSCQRAIAAIQTINNPFLALKKSREVKTPRDEKKTLHRARSFGEMQATVRKKKRALKKRKHRGREQSGKAIRRAI
jgi:hypothetical protein